MDTKIVQFHGGPGSGKSSLAYYLAGKLKFAGCDAELAMEYAKDLTWDKRLECLEKKQEKIFGEQLARIKRLMGKVKFIITDSPLILSAIYGDPTRVQPSFFTYVVETYKSLPNIDLFVNRTKKYNPNGRNQNEEGARKIDLRIQSFLRTNGIGYSIVDSSEEQGNLLCSELLNGGDIHESIRKRKGS